VPLLYLLKKKGITSLHGTFQEYMNIKTIPTFHPAYLLRNPAAKREAWNDLKKVMKEFGKTPLPVHKRT
jgi:DNA polymerase